MPNLLLELMSEEMPASILEASSSSIEKIFLINFKKNNIIFDSHKYYYGPKRLTYFFSNIKSLNTEVFIKGPNIKAPKHAILGFAKSQQISISKLKIKKTDKGDYYYFIQKIKEKDTISTIIKIFENTLTRIPWKKSMRWGFSKLRWARPLKNILCFYGDKNLKINLLGYSSKNYILDSDLLTREKIKIKSINQYFDELSNYNIIIDHNERKKIILNEAKKYQKPKG